jgi:hypothetical protein
VFSLRPKASRLRPSSDAERLNPERSSRLGSREFAEILDLWSRTRARPRARTTAIRSRRCWLERSEKDRFDMAYPTGFQENASWDSLSSPGLWLPLGRNGRRRNGTGTRPPSQLRSVSVSLRRVVAGCCLSPRLQHRKPTDAVTRHHHERQAAAIYHGEKRRDLRETTCYNVACGEKLLARQAFGPTIQSGNAAMPRQKRLNFHLPAASYTRKGRNSFVGSKTVRTNFAFDRFIVRIVAEPPI